MHVQHDVRILYQRILDGLRDKTHTRFSGRRRRSANFCSNNHELVDKLEIMLSEFDSDYPFYIVLDQAQYLRSLNDSSSAILPFLLRLSEFTRGRVGCILVSQVAWELFREDTGTKEPLTLHFNSYKMADLRSILLEKYDEVFDIIDIPKIDVNGMEIDPDEMKSKLKQCHEQFVALMLSFVQNVSAKMSDLEYLMRILFPKYVRPVIHGELEPSSTSQLFNGVKFYIRDILNKIYLREVSSEELMFDESQVEGERDSGDTHLKSLIRQQNRLIELPLYTKYLIISSFLASYNPSKFDLKFFAKSHSRKSKGGRITSAGGRKTHRLIGSLQSGPAYFVVDRMLGIFHNIVEEPVPTSINLYHQIGSLISLKFLGRCSNSLDKSLENGMRLKCNVKYDMVKNIAKTVDFDLCKYIYDKIA